MFLLASAALAGMVTSVPPGETRVGLLLCRTEAPCADDGWWIETLPGERARPLLMLDAVLEIDGAEIEGTDTLRDRFVAAMGRARVAWTAKRWNEAEFALSDADALLRRWSGTVSSQDLFDLAYWRAAVALQKGEDPTDDLRQAAASAWNREVRLALEDGAVATAYYDELPRLVAGGTGTLRLAAPPLGALWYLDGVELGGNPYEVQVFPGTHRVTAVHADMLRTWKKDVLVARGRTSDVAAAFTEADDPKWVRDQLRAAYTSGTIPKEIKELLSAWCARRNVHELRVLMVEEPQRLRTLTYDPGLRRLTPE